MTEQTDILAAVRQLGDRPLSEALLVEHIWPLFSRVRAQAPDEIYLANHSLGRPLDQTMRDVQEAMSAWYQRLNDAWESWLSQREYFRNQVADLIHAPSGNCIIPKTSAGQGLRAILNAFDDKLHVLTTGGEFDSIDFILKLYAGRGRIDLTMMEADAKGRYETEQLAARINGRTHLVVISEVMFLTGQWLSDLPLLVETAHKHDAMIMVDLYHAAGVLPVDIQAMDADFAIGGCYKYLRGGPGTAWLYIHPRHLNGRLRTLDTGWFAQPEPFTFKRPPVPLFSSGGSAFLESTPAVLPFYQAKAGLEFTQAIGVERLRDYSLQQQNFLAGMLREQGIEVFDEPATCGAFVAVPNNYAVEITQRLSEVGIRCDSRENFLRLCPDILNTKFELRLTAEQLSKL
ncbi:MAG: aminotransferase class V-fold PLP-dependent enzyme [Candidatus Thiodiazotropha sp. (ex Monitilora ramsayi)]|nr:aminotransferase class V-fold PLP-dependent enzyme [Candidatus Thiodiazotropha sp. (ex Monitilora ramsayi)]